MGQRGSRTVVVKINNCSKTAEQIIREGRDAVTSGSATVIRADQYYISNLDGDHQNVTEEDWFKLSTEG